MNIEERKYRKGYLLKAGDNIIQLVKRYNCYDFKRFKLTDNKNVKLINEFKKRLYQFAKKNKCFIQSEDTERDRLQSQFLIDCGLVIRYSKLNFEKNLNRHEFLYDDIFNYRSLKETGMRKFYDILKVSCTYPPKNYETFMKTNDVILKSYNPNGDYKTTDFWQTVYLKNKPIGLIMPYQIRSTYAPHFKKFRTYGTLIYIGLIKEMRNKGYGRIIHSRGLMLMKEMGLVRYLGSTKSNNHSMIRVFKINKCRHTMSQNFYKAI